MSGFSVNGALSSRVQSVQADMFLVHTGILDFNYRRTKIYQGLYFRDNKEDWKSIIRILNLKKFYGYLSIKEID